MLRIEYIYHSGFYVETEHKIFIFDWYKGKIPKLPENKRIYVFVSHFHADHYGSCIWSLPQDRTSYLLDRKVNPGFSKRKKIEEGKIKAHMLTANKHYSIDGIEIDTLFSTDEGLAFSIQADGYRIYHAGDLNIWYWEDEPEEDNKWQQGMYRKQMTELKKTLGEDEIDVAFLPLDPRLEDHAADGVLSFLKEIPCKALFPMHYWEQKEKCMSYVKQKEFDLYRKQIRFEEEAYFE